MFRGYHIAVILLIALPPGIGGTVAELLESHTATAYEQPIDDAEDVDGRAEVEGDIGLPHRWQVIPTAATCAECVHDFTPVGPSHCSLQPDGARPPPCQRAAQ